MDNADILTLLLCQQIFVCLPHVTNSNLKLITSTRVATHLENPEYSGISLNMENSWNSQEFCATSGKNSNK